MWKIIEWQPTIAMAQNLVDLLYGRTSEENCFSALFLYPLGIKQCFWLSAFQLNTPSSSMSFSVTGSTQLMGSVVGTNCATDWIQIPCATNTMDVMLQTGTPCMTDIVKPTYLHTYLPTNLPTNLHTNLPTILPTILLTYLPTFLPTYLPTH